MKTRQVIVAHGRENSPYVGLVCHAFLCRVAMLVVALSLAGCSRTPNTGPVEIMWDRDTCDFCRMVISAKGYAAQVRSGSDDRVFKFDDIGCALNWMAVQGVDNSAEEVWVGDYRYQDQVHWLNAHRARYMPDQATPMDYGYGAIAESQEGSVSFSTARRKILSRDESR